MKVAFLIKLFSIMNTYSSLKYYQLFIEDRLILKFKGEKSKNQTLLLLVIELKRAQDYVRQNKLLISLLISNHNKYNQHSKRRK